MLRGYRAGRLARASGIVTHRQRPETAKGVVFVTLEDETGAVNVIVWPQVVEAQRRPLLASTLLTVYGVWQCEAARNWCATWSRAGWSTIRRCCRGCTRTAATSAESFVYSAAPPSCENVAVMQIQYLSQAVTPELREWIIAQLAAGCAPDDLVATMRASGWEEGVARGALQRTLADKAAQERPRAPTLPQAVPVPEPDIAAGAALPGLPDREVQVLVALNAAARASCSAACCPMPNATR